MAATADGQPWRADTVTCFSMQVVLYNPVFERMEADHDEAPASVNGPEAEQPMSLRECRVKAVEFTIDTNPKRKEDPGGGVNLGLGPCAPHGLLDRSG